MNRNACRIPFLQIFTAILFCGILFQPSPSRADFQHRGMVVTGDINHSDITELGPWKANVVRYPIVQVQQLADRANEEKFNEWVDEELAKLDEKLPAFTAARLQVIILLSTAPGGFKSYTSPRQHRLFSDEWTQGALVRVWRKIAQHYAGNSTILGFDIVNEPAQRTVAPGLKDWSRLSAAVAAAIREVNDDHLVFVEAPYGQLGRLSALKPIRLPGIVYSFHYYYPTSFKLQGFDGRPINSHYPSRNFDKKEMLASFKKAISYQQKNKVQLYVGEFSAVRWAPKGSAYRYLADLISIFEKYHWHWTYHAYREADCWSVEHGSNPKDRRKSSKSTDRQRLLMKYFAKNVNSL